MVINTPIHMSLCFILVLGGHLIVAYGLMIRTDTYEFLPDPDSNTSNHHIFLIGRLRRITDEGN